MSVLDFNSYSKVAEERAANKPAGGNYKVGFFKIAVNESKVVKFPYSSVEDITMLVDSHSVKLKSGAFRRVDCIGDGCPLCASGNKVSGARTLVKLVEFSQDENGNLVNKALVWDAPESVGEKLKGFVKIYKDTMPNVVFVLTKKGTGFDTKYEIEPDTDGNYDTNLLATDFSDFADYNFEGSLYHSLNKEELEQLVITGEMPKKQVVEAINQGGGLPFPQKPAVGNATSVSTNVPPVTGLPKAPTFNKPAGGLPQFKAPGMRTY